MLMNKIDKIVIDRMYGRGMTGESYVSKNFRMLIYSIYTGNRGKVSTFVIQNFPKSLTTSSL